MVTVTGLLAVRLRNLYSTNYYQPPFQNICHFLFIVSTLTKIFFLKKIYKYLKIYNNNNKIYFITNLVIYKH